MIDFASYPPDIQHLSLRHEFRTGLYTASCWRYEDPSTEPPVSNPAFDFRENKPGATVHYFGDPAATPIAAIESLLSFLASDESARKRWNRTRESDIDAAISGLGKPATRVAERKQKEDLFKLLDL